MNIKLNLQGAKKVASGLPWVTVKDLEHFKQLPPAGEIVRLQDSMGNFLAHAVSDGPRSAVPYRILSRERHPEFNAAFFEAAVETALRRRRDLMLQEGSVRLVHGEADGLPGVFCDRHGGALFLEHQSPGMKVLGPMIEEALWRQGGARSLWFKSMDGWERARGEGLPEKFQSKVADLKFWVRLDGDIPADFDLEQRMNYARLGELGIRGEALVAFNRRGDWAAAALKAGCDRALCLERDTSANTCALENLELNGLAAGLEFMQGDAMERLEKLKSQARRFGFVMACMPRKSAGSRLNFQASKHSSALAAKVFSLLGEGGVAAFSLASSELSSQGFQNALQRGAKEAGVEVELVAAGRNAADFPELAGFEQGLSRRFLAMKIKALA